MANISFEWDEEKRALNKKKHGISFEEAQTVFVDENALLLTTRTIHKRKIDLYFLV